MRTPTEQPKHVATVGIREFRQRLAAYLLESDAPVAITRHGDTVGYFIPARRKRSAAQREALEQAAAQLDALLAAKGVTEDELVADFKRLRASKRGRGPTQR
jgi:PHD/YefM family antitoxin component YafN of YafNO toxin-antitoxin module